MPRSEFVQWQALDTFYPINYGERLQAHFAKVVQTIINFSMGAPEGGKDLGDCVQYFDPDQLEQYLEYCKKRDEEREKAKKKEGAKSFKQKWTEFTQRNVKPKGKGDK